MEQTSKAPLIIGGIVVIVMIAGVAWYAMQTQQEPSAPVMATVPKQSTQHGAPQENPADEGIIVSTKDSSDAALDQDLSGIDKQITSLDQDSSTITEGINTPSAAQ